MIIGFDGSRAFQDKQTGTEIYSYQLLKALAKIDRKNQYIVYLRGSQNKSRDSSLITQNDKIQWPGNFEFKVIKWLRFWTQIGLAKQTFSEKLDVLFIPAHTSPLIHKRGLKTVVTVHDLGAEYLPKMHQVKQRLYLKWITRYQLRSASKLIAVSKSTRDDLVKKVGIEPGKIKLVYEGYDKELFKQVKDDILVNNLRQFNLVSGSYFLFVGTVQPRKNLERLIKSFGMFLGVLPARFPAVHPRSTTLAAATRQESLLAVTPRNERDFLTARDFTAPSLVVVGSKGWLSDSIYKLPKKLGIGTQVKFFGRVDDKDLPALYSGAIALTFPSLFEGFGLPILEAQASGCPVLTSNISSMPEVAGKGAIYVNPYSVDDIVRGMERIKNKELRIKLIKTGLENVKRFSWEKCARETLKVLEEVS